MSETTDAADATTTTVVPADVAAHLEALNLAGLSFATKRLLGKDPAPLTGQFTMWARSGADGLPPITEHLWTALSPLGIGRPAITAAALCQSVLTGQERDAAVGLRAATDCARAGKARIGAAPMPVADDATGDAAKAVRVLVTSVKDYWRAVGTMYGQVRAAAVDGDLPAAVERTRQLERAAGKVIGRIGMLSALVAGETKAPTGRGEPVPRPPLTLATPDVERADDLDGWADDPVVDDPDEAARVAALAAQPTEALPEVGDEPQVQPEEVGPTEVLPTAAPLDDRGEEPVPEPEVYDDPVEARAAAFAQARRIVPEEVTPAKPVEVLSTKPVREHRFLPIVFLLLVVAGALYVVYSILNAPNPLTQ